MQKNIKKKQKSIPNNVMRLEKEKRIRRYRIIKLILKVLVLVGLLVGLIVYAFTSPMFNITEISIFGNEKFEKEEYINLSELKIDENIFNFSKSKVISKIKTNSYVEEVIIKRKLPSKVEITIKERTPNYIISLGEEGFAYINNQGYILEKSIEKIPLIEITGISTETENIIEGKRLNNEDLEKLQSIIQIKDAMSNIQIDGELNTINIENKSNYILTLEKEAKEIQLGEINNLSSKMLFIKVILEEQEGIPGTIYLNQDQVYFSPK